MTQLYLPAATERTIRAFILVLICVQENMHTAKQAALNAYKRAPAVKKTGRLKCQHFTICDQFFHDCS